MELLVLSAVVIAAIYAAYAASRRKRGKVQSRENATTDDVLNPPGSPADAHQTLQDALDTIQAERIYLKEDTFESSELLASWVHSAVACPWPLDKDSGQTPHADIRSSKNITLAQVERIVREQSLLRMVGVLLFVQEAYDDEFFLTFFRRVVRPLAAHRYDTSEPNASEVSETRDALEAYLTAFAHPTSDGRVRRLYFDRIYHDHDELGPLMNPGIGKLGVSLPLATYEKFRDQYSKAVYKMPYKSLKITMETMVAVEKEEQQVASWRPIAAIRPRNSGAEAQIQ